MALVGIVLTLSYQAREAKLAREETRRQAVGDLLKMAMEDPDLDECWGPVPPPDDPKTRKQLLYTNMIISEWSLSFETRAFPEARRWPVPTVGAPETSTGSEAIQTY